ncbi:MAG: hypothetical protein ABIX28_19965 [Vicinamibacterales bacterium]
MSLNRLLQAAFVLVAGVGLAAQAANPLVGSWKLNAAKSKGSAYTSGTTVVTAAGAGITMKVTLTGPDGVHDWSFTANFDGKDVPVTGKSPYGDTVSLTRTNAQTTQVAVKRAGKATVTQTIVVAADGKSRTTTTKGVDAAGKPVDAVSVYERQ